MTVLVAFASVEGQTEKIARFITDTVTEAKHEVHLVNTDELTEPISLVDTDQVILVAPVHERRHPASFEAFIRSHKDLFANKKSLVLSVSLKAAFTSGRDEAKDYLTEMLLRTDFQPDASALVAGAVRPDTYDYFEKEIVQHVVLLGRKIDPKEGLREFTDWGELKSTVLGFLNGSNRENQTSCG